MIKLTFCLRRLPHLSRVEFQTYWRETHGPLVEKHRDALKFSTYNQVHTIDSAMGYALGNVRGAPLAFDGFAEMTWASEQDLEVAMTSTEGRAAGRELLADEKRFIDLEQSPISLGTIPFKLSNGTI